MRIESQVLRHVTNHMLSWENVLVAIEVISDRLWGSIAAD
jgi:hypothetical protein